MIDAIAAIGAALSELQSNASATSAPSLDQLVPEVAGAEGAATTFAQVLSSALGEVNQTIAGAESSAQAFASGDQSQPLSDVMVSLEQANLALQMASGVRDKVVAAYSNIMNMQV
ncbi:MAG TPA: flagellar hook-basal body complex protein FliE [Stellaceae bacterium]|nr:flagellar hook-basal body complex protein FliE [Stellaceae bacterium]